MFEATGKAVVLRSFVVLVLAVSLAGCGGGTEPEQETTTDAAASPEDASPEETDSDSDAGDPFCEAATALLPGEEKVSKAIQKAEGDPAAVQNAYKEFVTGNEQNLQALVDSAPADIKESVEAYVGSHRAYAAGDVEKGMKLNGKAIKALGYVRATCLG